MENKNEDIFIGSVNTKTQIDNDNFFLSEEMRVAPSGISETTRRLNDYDFNLLKEDAYKDISDDALKLEYKISKTETEIKATESQIQAARDIGDYNLVEELYSRLKILKEDYEALLAMYKDKRLSAKITDGILNMFGSKLKGRILGLKDNFSGITDVILSKMPNRFSKFIEIKKSLGKLENINKSVDDLVKLNIPYGEKIDKYAQLSKYIIKANEIQAEISRYTKKSLI